MKKYMQIVKEKLEKNKKEWIIWGFILLFCIIICSPLLQFHIASDTYNLMDLGYFAYPSQYFLKDARIVSTLVMYIAGFLHLPYEIFIVLMEILAVVIVAFSIYYLYKTIKEKTTVDSTKKIILTIMASSIVIFNCMSIEYLLYAECSVMCLSLLFSILAARTFTNNVKHKNIKTMLLIVVATFCYQGTVNIFLPLTLLFLFIDKNKKSIKKNVKEIALACIIIVLAYVINILCIYGINLLLGEEQSRISSGIFNNFSKIGSILSYIFERALLLNYNLWPIGITLVAIAITLILLLFQSHTKKVFEYLALVIIAMGVCIIPVFFMEVPSLEPRTATSIGAIVGMSFLYLLSIEFNKKILMHLISISIIAFFTFNAINTIQVFATHIAGNKIDANMGMTIKYRIEEYEKETGNVVQLVAYYRDENHQDYHYGWDKKLSSFGQRAFDNYYCIIEALNYYCNRDFKRTYMSQTIYDTYFAGKDWITYSDEQIVFQDNTMYICTY